MNNVANYKEQNGDKWVIGGTLEITKTGKITIDKIELTKVKLQAQSKATTIEELKKDFNELITKLKDAGIMATE